eukprot:SAG31_NODE_568_length_14006_cov_4.252119_6_plen_90_part_00
MVDSPDVAPNFASYGRRSRRVSARAAKQRIADDAKKLQHSESDDEDERPSKRRREDSGAPITMFVIIVHRTFARYKPGRVSLDMLQPSH